MVGRAVSLLELACTPHINLQLQYSPELSAMVIAVGSGLFIVQILSQL